MNPEQRAAFEAKQFKPGQSGNPEGRNGWTVMREKYRQDLDKKITEITEKLLDLAANGDIQAIALALKPIINVSAIELSGPDGAPVNFIELAKKAQEKSDAE